MAVSGCAEVRQLSQLELMGHLFRRAGFGETRDELETASLMRREDGHFNHVAKYSRHRIQIYERVCAA